MENKEVKVTLRQTGDTRKGNGKSWMKVITGIDKSKDKGYSLLGKFVREGEHLLPEGTIILIVGIEGSWKNNKLIANIYKVNSEYKDDLEFIDDFDYYKSFFSMREKLEELLSVVIQ